MVLQRAPKTTSRTWRVSSLTKAHHQEALPSLLVAVDSQESLQKKLRAAVLERRHADRAAELSAVMRQVHNEFLRAFWPMSAHFKLPPLARRLQSPYHTSSGPMRCGLCAVCNSTVCSTRMATKFCAKKTGNSLFVFGFFPYSCLGFFHFPSLSTSALCCRSAEESPSLEVCRGRHITQHSTLSSHLTLGLRRRQVEIQKLEKKLEGALAALKQEQAYAEKAGRRAALESHTLEQVFSFFLLSSFPAW